MSKNCYIFIKCINIFIVKSHSSVLIKFLTSISFSMGNTCQDQRCQIINSLKACDIVYYLRNKNRVNNLISPVQQQIQICNITKNQIASNLLSRVKLREWIKFNYFFSSRLHSNGIGEKIFTYYKIKTNTFNSSCRITYGCH